MENKKRVLSAIQPTGDIHIGNYFGAIQNWVRLQEDYTCTFGVVDYHAMTSTFDPKKLRENTWDIIFSLLALGIKPESLFIQSLVPEHTELGWILNCFASYGLLTRMTQFKDKSDKLKDDDKEAIITVGLFDYPVLQAADILIYKADYVPVGKDQEQHLELTRDIAGRFNHQMGQEYFVMPETLFTESPKILSLADPTKKMSKSLGDKHYVGVFEEDKVLRKKVKSAITDDGENQRADNMSPGVENLLTIIKACGHREIHDQLLAVHNDENTKLLYGELKGAAADALAEMIGGFREKRAELNEHKKSIKEQIKASSAEIRKVAQVTLKEVKELCGLQNVKY
jgi:tryptophanyl-tRNA synthetase